MSAQKRHLLVLLAIAAIAALLPGSASAAPTVTSVTSGLDSPRGIAFRDGQLYVAEAGHGADGCTGFCVGTTGQVSKVNTATHTHTTLVTGLFSLALGGPETIGASGLAATEESLLLVMGGSPQEAGASQAGQLLSIHGNGSLSPVVNVGSSDFIYTLPFTEPTAGVYSPGTQEHDSNPYGILVGDDGAYIADAGSNTLDRISEEGKIKILAYDGWRDPNPNNFPSDSVPTCVVKTSTGFLVGELSGRVLNVHGSSITVINNALFSHITGCVSDHHGNVYFVNMFGPGPVFTPPPASNFFIGNVVKYNTRTGQASMLVDGLQFPNMDTIGPDGNLYVTVGSVCRNIAVAGPPCNGATGGVIKISLPHRGEND